MTALPCRIRSARVMLREPQPADADAVFGLLYAQCEDDFPRVEMNYIEKLGRLAEVKGKSFLYEDLLMRLLIDPAEAQEDYQKSPQWLKQICNAFADAINYFLYKHSFHLI